MVADKLKPLRFFAIRSSITVTGMGHIERRQRTAKRQPYQEASTNLRRFAGAHVRIIGRNLNAAARPNVRLYAGIARHRVPWIEVAEGTHMIEAAKDTVIIEEVRIT